MKYILVLLFVLLGSFPSKAKDPNVLFIAVDDLRPLLGAYGHEEVITPNIDKLAAGGTVFLNASCQFPVCGPSRASILTGMRPETTGIMDLKTKMRDIHPDVITLPQHFRNNGYVTAAAGKIFDPRCVDSRAKGDEISWTLPYNEGPKSDVPEIPATDNVTAVYDLPDEAFPDGRILKGGLEYLEKVAATGKPFFLAVGFKKPHLPFIAPKRFWDLYDPAEIQLEPYQEKARNNSGYGNWSSSETRGYGGVPKEGIIPDPIQRNMIHGYRACVSWVDHLVGKLLAELDSTGLRDNTIIVLWGDHGFHLGDHGIWGKHTTFEEAIRAPLMIIDPRIGKTVKTESPVEFTDVYPTLCELAGLPVPDQVQGISLVDCLTDEQAAPRTVNTAIHKAGGAYGYSVRNKRYRYIEWIDTNTAEIVGRDLFDFEKDPLGRENMAVNPEYKEVVSYLSAQLHANSTGWTLLERHLGKD